MKKIVKLLYTFMFAAAIFTSCEFPESNWDAIVGEVDPTSGFYVQFINASKTLETGVTEDGDLIDIETTIAVSLMGMPQSQDINVNLAIDPSTTIASNMYTLSANSITIPAGKTSGSVTFKTIAENMPVGQTLKLVINLDAGSNNSPSDAGTKLSYNLKRIEFCPLENGAADLVGSWSGTDAWYSSIITTELDGEDLAVSGMSVNFIQDWWAEEVTSGGTITMKVFGNGIVDIPRQYLYTTTYEGAPYDYEIEGTGKWENCGDKPRLIITYDVYYAGEARGLAATYSSYLNDIPYLTADVTLN